jgi:membrane dipeptidase
MVTFVPAFVSADCRDWDAAVLDQMRADGQNHRDWHTHMAAAARYAEAHPPPVATVAQVADHVEHVREVAGLAHVGIGSDFDGCDPMPAGLGDVSGFPALIAALLDRGWSEAEIAALTQGNVLRTWHDAAACAVQ